LRRKSPSPKLQRKREKRSRKAQRSPKGEEAEAVQGDDTEKEVKKPSHPDHTGVESDQRRTSEHEGRRTVDLPKERRIEDVRKRPAVNDHLNQLVHLDVNRQVLGEPHGSRHTPHLVAQAGGGCSQSQITQGGLSQPTKV
jgi:hypothetical protein